MRTISRSLSVCLIVWFLSGCSRTPSRIYPPDVDSGAASEAMRQYDVNGDGMLDEGELDKSPPLKAAISRIDQNGNRKIEPSEIDARIVAWKESKVGLLPMTIRLHVKGRPLTNSDVLLEPEPFLGEGIKAARGTTNQHGVAVMEISSELNERGVHSGFYRIRVSKKSGGREVIPARYNVDTQLGVEVEPVSPESRDVSINLNI